MKMSTIAETKREAGPASIRCSSTPSGGAIVRTSSYSIRMNLERFLRTRTPSWVELDELVERSGRRPERLGARRVQQLGALYRSAAADLALARRRFPGDPATVQLELRVSRARHLVYSAPPRRESLLAFVRRDYWRAVRARRLQLAVAAAILVGSTAISGVWADRDPGRAAGLVPGAYSAVTQPRPHGS